MGWSGRDTGNAAQEKQAPGGLTGNALITGVICAVLRQRVMSFFVARWQAQEANRQASTAQVAAGPEARKRRHDIIQQVSHLTDGRHPCASQATLTPSCKKSNRNRDPRELAGRRSTQAYRNRPGQHLPIPPRRAHAETWKDYALDVLANTEIGQSLHDELNMQDAYAELLARCGQLGQNTSRYCPIRVLQSVDDQALTSGPTSSSSWWTPAGTRRWGRSWYRP